MIKQTLPSYDKYGNDPVRSWYMIPLFLLANAPKQNTFAIDSSSSSPIRFGRFVVFCTGCGCSAIYASGTAIIFSCGGKLMIGTLSIPLSPLGLGHVLLMPWRGLFMCPFAVAGLGLRYFRINFLVKFGHPFRKPFRTAFNSVDNFGLHSN